MLHDYLQDTRAVVVATCHAFWASYVGRIQAAADTFR